MRFHHAIIQRELARGDDASAEVMAKAFAAGEPFCKDAMPHLHPRLSPVPPPAPINHHADQPSKEQPPGDTPLGEVLAAFVTVGARARTNG
jgi:hypothetical protein